MVNQQPLLQSNLPVYDNSDGQYLYYWNALGEWRIGNDYQVANAVVADKHHIKDCPNYSWSWTFFHGGSWNHDASFPYFNPDGISVICMDIGNIIILHFSDRGRSTFL